MSDQAEDSADYVEGVWLYEWYADAPVGSVPEQQDYSESLDKAQRGVAGRKGQTK